jgi:hypothetical protein
VPPAGVRAVAYPVRVLLPSRRHHRPNRGHSAHADVILLGMSTDSDRGTVPRIAVRNPADFRRITLSHVGGGGNRGRPRRSVAPRRRRRTELRMGAARDTIHGEAGVP